MFYHYPFYIEQIYFLLEKEGKLKFRVLPELLEKFIAMLHLESGGVGRVLYAVLWWLNANVQEISSSSELEKYFISSEFLNDVTNKYPELKLQRIRSDPNLYKVYRDLVVMDIFELPIKTKSFDPASLNLQNSFPGRREISLQDLTGLFDIWTSVKKTNSGDRHYVRVPQLILDYLALDNSDTRIPFYSYLHRTTRAIQGKGKVLEALSTACFLYRMHRYVVESLRLLASLNQILNGVREFHFLSRHFSEIWYLGFVIPNIQFVPFSKSESKQPQILSLKSFRRC